MTTRIYYFTGSGNSLKIAQMIAEQLDGCEMMPMAAALHERQLSADAERVGFVFPLYFWRVPPLVLDFLEKIDLGEVDYLFAVITRGGSPGQAMHQLETTLKRKSKKLSAGFKVTMPGTYIKKYDVVSQEQREEIFESAYGKVNTIISVVREGRTLVERDSLFSRLLAKLRYRPWPEYVYRADESFFADESCTSCGICEQLCPVNNIFLVEEKPQWQHRCQQCFACVHFCPEQSIQVSPESEHRRRYHHPDITLKDMMKQRERGSS